MDINWLKWTFTGLHEAIQELRDKVTFLLGKIHRTVQCFNKLYGVYVPSYTAHAQLPLGRYV